MKNYFFFLKEMITGNYEDDFEDEYDDDDDEDDDDRNKVYI